jgi:predicted amidohydrolase YtcJ
VADLALLNANVRTMDPARPRAQAVVIRDGRILAVGSNDEVRSWISSQATLRDLAGRTVVPGFYDSHNHMLMTGLNLAAVDLSAARSPSGIPCCCSAAATTWSPIAARSSWRR